MRNCCLGVYGNSSISGARPTGMSDTLRRPIRKAVFPVAGLGTRFLPATKAIPKEMLQIGRAHV